MPDDVATLRDATAAGTEASNESSTTTATTTTQSSTTEPDSAETEALELGKFLIESGFTPQQAKELPEAARALQAMSSIIETNPVEFLAMLERTNPEAARNFHWKMAETFADRYEQKGQTESKGNGEAKTADPELWAEVK